jgi:uncharacterized iron-regulated protein
MKIVLAFILAFIPFLNGHGQVASTDFETIPVNKPIKEFNDAYDLSSPLNGCVSFNYLMINGRQGRLRSASSQRIRHYFAGADAPDSAVSEKSRNNLLNMQVIEVVKYKNEVAGVIGRYPESFYSIRFMSCEDGLWLNAGEDMGESVAEARQKIAKRAPVFYDFLGRIKTLSRAPADPGPFADFLKKEGRDPKRFVLDALARHQLVIYGEVHGRQWSWDFCRSLVRDVEFAKSVGTIFMEISAHSQGNLDAFLAKDYLDKELILEAFRDILSTGWHEKGVYEFLAEIWTLNKALPPQRKIKLVAVDIPRPFRTFHTAEEQKKFFDAVMDRNEFMAEAIEKTLRANRDDRHSLFIVGTGHVYKSPAPGLASSSQKGDPTAGSLLSTRLPKGGVFAIFTHQAIIDNSGNIPGRLRHGIFDEAFALNGNKPVAFKMDQSPFGSEPFDALPEISYRSIAGTYADNYDGYVFLGPLDREPKSGILYELYSDDFVKELDRRARLEGSTVQKWFEVEKAGKEAIIEKFRKQQENKLKWGKLPPLKTAKPER